VLKTKAPKTYGEEIFSKHLGKTITTVNSVFPLVIEEELIGACEISTDVSRVQEMTERIVDRRKELRDLKAKRSERDGLEGRRLFSFDDIIGESSAIKKAKEDAQRVAETETNVLVWGETGTGKELFVQAIHNASHRRRRPFVPQNCAALPESLLKGLVFGTSTGGFTGAVDRPGLLELASGGTLYLDGIDSMPLGLQAKLLRVIQDKRVRRLGDTKERSLNIRIIYSSSIDPREAVRAGLLRPDLYYRLSVVEVSIPPLRRRKEDIPLLCEHFLKKHLGIETKVMEDQVLATFLKYDWPGNVRELEHAIEAGIALARGPIIGIEDLPHALRSIVTEPNLPTMQVLSLADALTLKSKIRQEEKDAIEDALKKVKSVTGAARILGVLSRHNPCYLFHRPKMGFTRREGARCAIEEKYLCFKM
jgi:arginine utilization regulatory protein